MSYFTNKKLYKEYNIKRQKDQKHYESYFAIKNRIHKTSAYVGLGIIISFLILIFI